MLSRSQIIVSVYYISLLNNCDFLFKSITEAISLYIYLINDTFHSVIARNNINSLVIILRYLRLNIVSEIDYNNCYLVSSKEVVSLALTLTLAEEDV